jgi:hypothetical protein
MLFIRQADSFKDFLLEILLLIFVFLVELVKQIEERKIAMFLIEMRNDIFNIVTNADHKKEIWILLKMVIKLKESFDSRMKLKIKIYLLHQYDSSSYSSFAN